MIKALENNFIGLALAYFCGAMVAIALGIVVLWMLPASPDSSAAGAENLDDVQIAALEASKPFEHYEEISRRPVFNEDRRPAPVVEEEDGETELLVEEEIGAPEVELAGVVITPSIRMATLRSKEHKYSLVAFEGKPLEGNFGSWHVSSIADREVTLASSDGKELKLELQVHDSVIKEPPKPVSAAPEEDAVEEVASEEAVAENQEEQLSRAEEIRRRIAERREELRRQAEERQASNNSNRHSDAIQSAIQRSQARERERRQR